MTREMAQRVTPLLCRPADLSGIPGTHEKMEGGTAPTPWSCPLTPTCIQWHTPTPRIIKNQTPKTLQVNKNEEIKNKKRPQLIQLSLKKSFAVSSIFCSLQVCFDRQWVTSMLARRCGALSVLCFVKGHIFSSMTAGVVFRASVLPGAQHLNDVTNLAMVYFSWNRVWVSAIPNQAMPSFVLFWAYFRIS